MTVTTIESGCDVVHYECSSLLLVAGKIISGLYCHSPHANDGKTVSCFLTQ